MSNQNIVILKNADEYNYLEYFATEADCKAFGSDEDGLRVTVDDNTAERIVRNATLCSDDVIRNDESGLDHYRYFLRVDQFSINNGYLTLNENQFPLLLTDDNRF